MTAGKSAIKWIAFSVILLVAAAYLFFRSANYHSAIKATKEWACLDDFPASAEAISVEAAGNMFTRGFRVSFIAPVTDIDSWLEHSPGTANVKPTKNGTVRRYEILPCGGAQHAHLEVHEDSQTVLIEVNWS